MDVADGRSSPVVVATDFELPAGTFFDIAVVHLLTTATIDRLRALYPEGRFEVRRLHQAVPSGRSSLRLADAFAELALII